MKHLTKSEYDALKPSDKRASDCPFCKEISSDQLLRSNDYRNIIYPLKPCWWPDRFEKHLMLMPKKHHKNSTTLSTEELISKQEAEIFLEEYFVPYDYCSYLRHTDNIKTVQHIHYHYFLWNIRYRHIEESLLHYDEKYQVSFTKK